MAPKTGRYLPLAVNSLTVLAEKWNKYSPDEVQNELWSIQKDLIRILNIVPVERKEIAAVNFIRYVAELPPIEQSSGARFAEEGGKREAGRGKREMLLEKGN